MGLERCGLPKERRFSFFDQVHTTGMDIPQAATARAVLTLAADLIFRDYAQAAYRMRGIGKGQKITLFVIPEVSRLLHSEAALARGMTVLARKKQIAGLPSDAERERAHLQDTVGWLLLNAFRTERVQFELWCSHCATNVWRKEAFATLKVSIDQVGELVSGGDKKGATNKGGWEERRTLEVFRDPVDHDVSNTVPFHVGTRDQILMGMAGARVHPDSPGAAAIQHVLSLLAGSGEGVPPRPPPPPPEAGEEGSGAGRAPKNPFDSSSKRVNTSDPQTMREAGAGMPVEISSFGEEQEQQQEQEEEQEKEQQQQQQKEQEQEVEEPETFVKEKYAREEEHPKTWPLAALCLPPSDKQLGFFPANEFTVHRSVLEKRGPLHWPADLHFSSDHTHPRWRFSSHRRIKNINVLLEWMPDSAGTTVSMMPRPRLISPDLPRPPPTSPPTLPRPPLISPNPCR